MDRRLEAEVKNSEALYSLFCDFQNYAPKDQILNNLTLFLDRIAIGDLLFLNEVYRIQMQNHGIIAEFGSRWGKNLSILTSLRSILEPYNHTRKIISFDTFTGLMGTSREDGESESVQEGEFSTGIEYVDTLKKILENHESRAPITQIKKHQIVVGDVRDTLDDYLDKNPETIFSFVYFDMDIYEPTKYCLSRIKSRIMKGTVIGFDEACNSKFPGETIALLEELDIGQIKLKRSTYSANASYFLVGE
jgi:hypothetical protein